MQQKQSLWYGNWPEETHFFANRMSGMWLPLTLAIVILMFVIPFFGLSRAPGCTLRLASSQSAGGRDPSPSASRSLSPPTQSSSTLPGGFTPRKA